ncbi:hypothetical protein LSTR_LSTR012590 [Laodelphax striatellus]|uniref:Uncharacterized protein n=1 Tax=Laodelphax striatellus TaxID=195883 RepID=A0A482X3B3_LAOST|nr:hypothetical protein LSTR_LSTR012590 [Laodelphax striatellus]
MEVLGTQNSFPILSLSLPNVYTAALVFTASLSSPPFLSTSLTAAATASITEALPALIATAVMHALDASLAARSTSATARWKTAPPRPPLVLAASLTACFRRLARYSLRSMSAPPRLLLVLRRLAHRSFCSMSAPPRLLLVLVDSPATRSARCPHRHACCSSSSTRSPLALLDVRTASLAVRPLLALVNPLAARPRRLARYSLCSMSTPPRLLLVLIKFTA